ncbi:CPBP family intramembrane metalloprotease [Cellulomonas iranensis]|uniref:CPBP family intramembrane glutamic endopeptidase n=1 Tax=Cellulomonas iranensis TaxID=76862 RepID=UPI001CF17DB1|nr:type II CAAX endopeptidase family protein [Cellulomonas iranensis]UCN14027.1 CPBP family intramembrane metalloprotease [Cellulomonas iranensis]
MSSPHVVPPPPTVAAPPTVSAPRAVRAREVPGTYAYHRLQRTRPGARWWRPLLVGLVALALYVALLALGGGALLVAAFAGGPASWDALTGLDVTDLLDPLAFTLAMLSIIAMLPAVLVATRLLGARPVGLLASVTGRVRWGWALRCLALAAGLALVVHTGDAVVAAASGRPWQPDVDAGAWLLIGLALLLVPAQCVAEEVVFRGYLLQTVGAWLRHPAFAIALPVPLFVLGHEYVNLAMLDIALWALAMGWVTWRTGGLEAAAAAHVVNNVAVFTLGAVGLADLDLVDVGPVALTVSTVHTLVLVGLVEVLARRAGVARERVVAAPAEGEI